jgi:Zn-dependent M28 family amino/carboxypeptidase
VKVELRKYFFRFGCALAMSAGALRSSAAQVTAAKADSVITESDVRRILSTLAADSMEGRKAGTRGGAMAAAFVAGEMKAIGLAPVDSTGYFHPVPTLGSNVIGVLPGSDSVLRDQIVVIAAHYDHLGIGDPVNGDSIYNGADDDASGVTAVLEIARALKSGSPPRRTVIFIATTGEEEGVKGTQYLVAHPAFSLSKMVAEMEVEMIGRPDPKAGGEGKGWMTGYDRSTMGSMLRAAGVPIVADPYPQMHFFERSDNIVFAQMGIPAHTLSSYDPRNDYHVVTDDVSKINFAHVTGVIRAGAMAARLLADGPAPTWNPGGRPN